MRSMALLVLGAVSAMACGSQVDATYHGEALLTVKGDVVASSTAAAAVDAAIAWVPTQYVGRPERPPLIAARVSVRASFPAAFELSALTPPPAGAQISADSAEDFFQHFDDPGYEPKGIGYGYIVALSRSATGPTIQPSDVAGVDVHHLVVWFDHDDPTASATADFVSIAAAARRLGVPATRGYHLVTTDPAQRARRDQCDDGGLCIKHVYPTSDTTTFIAQQLTYEYEQCLTRSPTTCTLTYGCDPRSGRPSPIPPDLPIPDNLQCDDPSPVLTPEQVTENERCQSLSAAAGTDVLQHDLDCADRFPAAIVPGEMPIHVELGTSLFAAIIGG